MRDFLYNFTDCIPHSVYDESFEVFDILLDCVSHSLDEGLMQKCIMNLIDQFTVKSKT